MSQANSWDDLPISVELLRGIYSCGFDKPSEIQSKACLPIINGSDIIAQAQSGTGKTATFSIGALSRVDVTVRKTQAIIISNTRELATQTANTVRRIGSCMEGLHVQSFIGGTPVNVDLQLLKQNTPHIVSGTPGRLLSMIDMGNISARDVKLLILDEADELLSSGFHEQIYKLLECMPSKVQFALFSATLPDNINDIAERFMTAPVSIKVNPEELTLKGIKQYFVAVRDDQEKYSVIKDIYPRISSSQCIVYCNSVERTRLLQAVLEEDNFPACAIHSSMEPHMRKQIYDEFVAGKHRIMISTDVTSRGTDVQQVACVINFDLTNDIANYVHRIGRCGRWGRKGLSINFVTERDMRTMKELQAHYKCVIDELPTNFDVC